MVQAPNNVSKMGSSADMISQNIPPKTNGVRETPKLFINAANMPNARKYFGTIKMGSIKATKPAIKLNQINWTLY